MHASIEHHIVSSIKIYYFSGYKIALVLGADIKRTLVTTRLEHYAFNSEHNWEDLCDSSKKKKDLHLQLL